MTVRITFNGHVFLVYITEENTAEVYLGSYFTCDAAMEIAREWLWDRTHGRGII